MTSVVLEGADLRVLTFQRFGFWPSRKGCLYGVGEPDHKEIEKMCHLRSHEEVFGIRYILTINLCRKIFPLANGC